MSEQMDLLASAPDPEHEKWKAEATRLLRSIRAAPHMTAFELHMRVIAPRLEALGRYSAKARDHLLAQAELKRQALSETK